MLGEVDDRHLRFEEHAYNNYGVTAALYKILLTVITKAVKGLLGAVWTKKEEKSWDSSIKRVLSDIEKKIISTQNVSYIS